MRTRCEQDVEQIAAIIAESIALGVSLEDLKAQNQSEGFSFDVRYDVEDYVSETDWTRVEGVRLSRSAWERAVKLAEQYRQA